MIMTHDKLIINDDNADKDDFNNEKPCVITHSHSCHVWTYELPASEKEVPWLYPWFPRRNIRHYYTQFLWLEIKCISILMHVADIDIYNLVSCHASWWLTIDCFVSSTRYHHEP